MNLKKSGKNTSSVKKNQSTPSDANSVDTTAKGLSGNFGKLRSLFKKKESK